MSNETARILIGIKMLFYGNETLRFPMFIEQHFSQKMEKYFGFFRVIIFEQPLFVFYVRETIEA